MQERLGTAGGGSWAGKIGEDDVFYVVLLENTWRDFVKLKWEKQGA